MIALGQYVRAVLAEGIAVALPELEGFEPQLEREGVVTQLREHQKTFVLEDFFGNEHVCHINGAVAVNPETLDPFYHNWASTRAAQLAVASP